MVTTHATKQSELYKQTGDVKGMMTPPSELPPAPWSSRNTAAKISNLERELELTRSEYNRFRQQLDQLNGEGSSDYLDLLRDKALEEEMDQAHGSCGYGCCHDYRDWEDSVEEERKDALYHRFSDWELVVRDRWAADWADEINRELLAAEIERDQWGAEWAAEIDRDLTDRYYAEWSDRMDAAKRE